MFITAFDAVIFDCDGVLVDSEKITNKLVTNSLVEAGFDIPNFASPLHVEAAAQAAKLALYYGRTGIYNLAEDDGTLDCTKAIVELGFDPQFRIGV